MRLLEDPVEDSEDADLDAGAEEQRRLEQTVEKQVSGIVAGFAARRKLPSSTLQEIPMVVVDPPPSATAVTESDTVCGCDNGDGATKNPETGEPCPGEGSKFCVDCDHANDYFDFEDDGVCKHRPACVCPNGWPAEREADCSVIPDKCISCAGAELVHDQETLQCRRRECVWPQSFPVEHQYARVSSNFSRKLVPLNSSAPILLAGDSVMISCGGNNYTQNLGSSPFSEYEVVCDYDDGTLLWPQLDVFQCVQNFCDCPGGGSSVTGAGCPKILSSGEGVAGSGPASTVATPGGRGRPARRPRPAIRFQVRYQRTRCG